MFPKPWSILHHARTLGAENAHGVAKESFASPGTSIAVYGWAPPGAETEPFEAGRNAVQRDLDVYGDASLSAVSARDRVTLTGHYAGTYEVVGGVESFDAGPFGFEPGCRLSLSLVTEDAR